MARLYERADVFVFTSLRDSFGTQVLEAMAMVCRFWLWITRRRDFVPTDAGIKIPLLLPNNTLAGLAEGFDVLRSSLRSVEDGRRASAYAKTQTWEEACRCMSKLYEELLSRPCALQQNVVPLEGRFNILGVRTHAVQMEKSSRGCTDDSRRAGCTLSQHPVCMHR